MGAESFFLIFIVTIIGALIYFFAFSKTSKSDREEEKKLRKSLEDDFIIDPETGAKLTLEQAQSGIWNDEEVTYYDPKTDPLVSPEYFEFSKLVDYYKLNSDYEVHIISDADVEFLESSLMFQKYSYWAFYHSFGHISKNTIVSFVLVELNVKTDQLLYWLKDVSFSGHYKLYEISNTDKKIMSLSGVNGTFFNNYYCEPIKKTFYEIELFKFFEKIATINNLEIELLNSNLLIKTKNNVTQQDIDRLEEFLKQV